MNKLDTLVKPYMQSSATNHLFVLPTSRAKREFAKKSVGCLHKTLTIQELEERAVYLDDGVFVDDTLRLLLLRKASDFKEYEQLNIDREFLVFLEHAPFFLKFYDELFSEKVSLDDLLVGDIYAEYDSHIAVLKKLLDNYKKLLIKNNFLDKIVLTENYKINTEFIKDFTKITIVLDGMFSRFELDLINKISAITTVIIELELNQFDEKTKNSFLDFKLDLGYKYFLNCSNKTIVEKHKLPKINSAKIYKTQKRTLQVAGVKEIVYGLINDGLDPSKIAVILPDENFANTLKTYDCKNNFNLSMGLSFKNEQFYLELLALYNQITRGEKEDQLFFKRVSKSREELVRFRDIFLDNKLITLDEKIELFNEINGCVKGDIKDIVDRVFAKIKSMIKDENLSLIEILHIYINELKTATIDDTRGGKITVMGALESRGVEFDAVVVVDFNDEFVPVVNVKDQFINTYVRKMASLPTRYDRENLQRSLYYKLFSRSKQNIIFYVDNETSKPSRFLQEIYSDIEIKNFNINDEWIFKSIAQNKVDESEIELEIDLTKSPLSATKINSYFMCKREFYYRYIKQYRASSEIEDKSVALDIGDKLHNALKVAIKNGFNTKDELIKNIISIAKKDEKTNRLLYELDLWEKKLEKFAANEIKRKEDGVNPIHLEEEFKAIYNGINLYGKVDRVDRLSDRSIEVLDYKSGSKPCLEIANSFQLVIYKILLEQKYNCDIKVGFYELNSGKICFQDDIDKAIDLFNKILENYKEPIQTFSKTEDLKNCKYCEYLSLCKRLQ